MNPLHPDRDNRSRRDMGFRPAGLFSLTGHVDNLRQSDPSAPARYLQPPSETEKIIYIKFVELESQMLHAKFQDHRPSGSGEEDFFKVFTIFEHGGHLGHVTWTIYINFRSPFPRRLHIKFGFDWPSGFRGEDV